MRGKERRKGKEEGRERRKEGKRGTRREGKIRTPISLQGHIPNDLIYFY
jgi:hypothetical protein